MVPRRDLIIEVNGVSVRNFAELRQELARSYCKLKIYDSQTRTHAYYYTYLK